MSTFKRLTAVMFMAAISGCTWTAEERSQRVSGSTETDEVRVASRVGGRVVALGEGIRDGVALTKGQLICVLEAPELKARRQQIAALLSELIAGNRPQEIESARADWEAQTAELEFARSERRRVEDLFKTKTVAEAELDRAGSRVRVLEKLATAAESRHALLLAGTRPERIEQVRAQLAELESQIAELEVRAPASSTLETLLVRVGDVAGVNRDVAVLLLPETLWLKVFVPQTWLGHIGVGDEVEVFPDAHPGRKFRGVVDQIAREAEFTPRNVQTPEERIKQVFRIKIRLSNVGGQLRAGMSAEARFLKVPGSG